MVNVSLDAPFNELLTYGRNNEARISNNICQKLGTEERMRGTRGKHRTNFMAKDLQHHLAN